MKKQKKNIIRISSTKLSDFCFLSKQLLLKDLLKKHWDHFLLNYKYSKRIMGNFLLRNAQIGFFTTPSLGESEHKKTSFFSFKKEKFCHYNYLILAKLIDLIGNTQSVQNRIQKIVKIHTNYLELEKVFQIKFCKTSIFLSWISYLLSEQIFHFLKMNHSFLCKSKLLSKKNKLEIENNGNFLFFKVSRFYDITMVSK